jgi:hypothetical protein
MTDRERAEALAWLQTAAGAELLLETAQLPPDRLTRLTRLRSRHSAAVAAVAVELLELRRRAHAKFTQAEAMFFTPEGLEQSTGEAIARYRASRFPPGVPTLDAGCGIGGDAMALAERGPVLAVDRNPAAVVCACANLKTVVHGRAVVTSVPALLCADVTRLDLARLRSGGVQAAFFDPSRRGDSPTGTRRRLRNAEDYAPPLSFLETLREAYPALGVKVSPAIEDAALRRDGARVEFLSDRGECKEAVLWFGPLREALPPARGPQRMGDAWATVLRPGKSPATLAPGEAQLPPTSKPRAWLYEPDPAVIRARLVPVLAEQLNAHPLEPQTAYLTADSSVETPFAAAYRVLDWLPYSPKNVQAWLRTQGARLVAIKKRGVPLEPEALRRQWKDAGDRPVILILARQAGRILAVLCADGSACVA